MLNIHSGRKSFGILIIILGLVAIGFMVYFFFFYHYGEQEAVSPEQQINPVLENQEVLQKIQQPVSATIEGLEETPQLSAQELVQEDVKRVASSFAERFGTWSNQTNSGNLTDLKLFMTPAMQAWVDDYIAQNRQTDYEQYYGITTKAVVAEVKNYQADAATVQVQTKRTETKDNKTRIFNQSILIKLLKPGKEWRVDSAVWLET